MLYEATIHSTIWSIVLLTNKKAATLDQYAIFKEFMCDILRS